MMIRNKLVSLAALSMVLSTSGAAFAEHDYYTHGVTCQPFWGASGLLSYSESGVGNWSSSNASVSCPGVGTSQTEGDANGGHWVVTQGRVLVSDNSATAPLSCNVWAYDAYGWMTYGPLKYSCSTYGGCADLTTTYTGADWLVFDTSKMYSDDMLGYSCTLPPTAPYASWISDMVSATP